VLVVLTAAAVLSPPVYPADGSDSMYAFQEIPADSSWLTKVWALELMGSEDGVPFIGDPIHRPGKKLEVMGSEGWTMEYDSVATRIRRRER